MERLSSISIGGRRVQFKGDQLHCLISVFAVDLLHEPFVFGCVDRKHSRPLILCRVIPGQD